MFALSQHKQLFKFAFSIKTVENWQHLDLADQGHQVTKFDCLTSLTQMESIFLRATGNKYEFRFYAIM